MLKRFKESDEFFSDTGISQSNIYFKIRSHKHLCKFPILKKTLPLSILRVILSRSQRCVGTFGEKQNICFMIVHPCFNNFVQSGQFYPLRISSSSLSAQLVDIIGQFWDTFLKYSYQFLKAFTKRLFINIFTNNIQSKSSKILQASYRF